MSCPTCDGRGHVCIDDVCQAGECFHGDSACPTCFGDPDYEDGRYDDEDESECKRPCDPSVGCGECTAYWQRMKHEGFWNSAKHEWTDKGMREMCK